MPIFRECYVRVFFHDETTDLKQLFNAKTNGVYNKYVDERIEQRTDREWNNMLIAVSATKKIRDEFRHFVFDFSTIQHPIYFLKLDFQPSKRRRWFHNF